MTLSTREQEVIYYISTKEGMDMELFYWLTIGLFVLVFAIAIRIAFVVFKYAALAAIAVVAGVVYLIAAALS